MDRKPVGYSKKVLRYACYLTWFVLDPCSVSGGGTEAGRLVMYQLQAAITITGSRPPIAPPIISARALRNLAPVRDPIWPPMIQPSTRQTAQEMKEKTGVPSSLATL